MSLTILIPILVAVTSAVGGFVGTWFSARKSASVSRQTSNRQSTVKIAEFRQAWITELRNALAEFQSFGITPGLAHATQREFYLTGTKVELLMNRNDPRFPDLQALLYRFLAASSDAEKRSCNAAFVKISQDILKHEWETLKAELRTELL